MIKMTTTGHGFDNNQVAAEFKPINYYLNINGIQTHTQYNWDADCGENPIFLKEEHGESDEGQIGAWKRRRRVFDHEEFIYSPGD